MLVHAQSYYSMIGWCTSAGSWKMYFVHSHIYIYTVSSTLLLLQCLKALWLIFGVDSSLIFIVNNGSYHRLLDITYRSSSQKRSLNETESETKALQY